MKPGDHYRAKNTMFYRADPALKALSRDQRWVDFHRACGRCGLFFDDIDPINDDPKKDVTDRMRGAGYQAVAFRADQDNKGFYIQVFVSRGVGQTPVDAVVDAYRQAVAAGDPVKRGLDALFDGRFRALGEFPVATEAEVAAQFVPLPTPLTAPEKFNVEDLIG